MDHIIPEKRMANVKYKAVDILLDCKKIDSAESFIRLIDSVVDLCREDVRRIIYSKGLYFPDFDWIYKESVEMTLETFKKSHLRTIKRFLRCDDINEMTRILIQRIIANMRNITTDDSYERFVKVSVGVNTDKTVESLMLWKEEIESYDKSTIKIGLRRVWEDALEDYDFDEIDFAELCEKFGFLIEEVMEDSLLFKAEQTAGGNRQLVLFFDPND